MGEMQRSRREASTGDRRDLRQVLARIRRPLVAALTAAFLLLAAGHSTAAADSTDRPLLLPGDPRAMAAPGATGPVTEWIVAGRPGREARTVAAVHRAVPVPGPTNTWLTPTSRATAFARDLEAKGLLLYAEPNLLVSPTAYPQDRLAPRQWWLPMIVDVDNTTPPKVTPSSPTLALIEKSADPLHPDLVQAKLEDPGPIGPEEDLHGTIVAAIAGSPGEDEGIRGVWPGMRMRLFEQGDDCASTTAAVYRAARARSPVINMSYGFPNNRCAMHYEATEFAVLKGSLPIAAAGNTYSDQDNVPMRPATDPHVLSVSAIDQTEEVAGFATRNARVDMTAPGVDLLVPRIVKSGEDVIRDHAPNSGTSFSTPMVAAAATWLRQARSDLSARQVSRLLTSSARDLGPKGWDTDYGAGLLQINAALKATPPPDDPREPNDDIGWVNGSLLRDRGKKIVASRIYRPGREARELVRATISTRDDPVDVYRMRIGRETNIVFRIDQLAGDVAVQAYRSGSDSVRNPRRAFASTDRKAPLPEGIRIVNRSRKPRDLYLAIRPGKKLSGTYARYRVTVQSIR